MATFWLVYANLQAWNTFFRPEDDLHTLVKTLPSSFIQPGVISTILSTQNGTWFNYTHTIPHLCPPCRVDVQDPGIIKSLVIYVYSPNDKQLGVTPSIVEAAGSMGVPTHWPRGSFKILQFGPLLGKLKCHRLHLNSNSSRSMSRSQLRYCHHVSATLIKFKLITWPES